jgi:hypothetical protein
MPPGRWASASSFALPGSWQKQKVEFGPGAPGTACGAVGHLEVQRPVPPAGANASGLAGAPIGSSCHLCYRD